MSLRICPNCSKENQADSVFCSGCGARFEETPVAENSRQDLYPANAGQPNEEQVYEPARIVAANEADVPDLTEQAQEDLTTSFETSVRQQTQNATSQQPNMDPVKVNGSESTQPKIVIDTGSENKKRGKKNLLQAFCAVLAVFIIAGLGFKIASSVSKHKTGGEDKYTFFVQDNSLYYYASGKKDPILIADGFCKDPDDDRFFSCDAVAFIDNGKKVVYPLKVTSTDDSFSLYVKKLNAGPEKSEKLCDDVSQYSLTDGGKGLVYINTDGGLFMHDFKTRNKLASDAACYWIADDTKNLIYMDDKDCLYRVEIKSGEKQKIDSKVDDVEYVSDDLSFLCYEKDGKIYIKQGDGEPKKIDSGVEEVLLVDEKGYIYYTKEDEKSQNKTLLDYVEYSEQERTDDDELTEEKVTERNRDSWYEALYRYAAAKKLESIEVTVDSEKLFCYSIKQDESTALSNAYVSELDSTDNALAVKTYDNVDIKK